MEQARPAFAGGPHVCARDSQKREWAVPFTGTACFNWMPVYIAQPRELHLISAVSILPLHRRPDCRTERNLQRRLRHRAIRLRPSELSGLLDDWWAGEEANTDGTAETTRDSYARAVRYLVRGTMLLAGRDR